MKTDIALIIAVCLATTIYLYHQVQIARKPYAPKGSLMVSEVESTRPKHPSFKSL